MLCIATQHHSGAGSVEASESREVETGGGVRNSLCKIHHPQNHYLNRCKSHSSGLCMHSDIAHGYIFSS